MLIHCVWSGAWGSAFLISSWWCRAVRPCTLSRKGPKEPGVARGRGNSFCGTWMIITVWGTGISSWDLDHMGYGILWHIMAYYGIWWSSDGWECRDRQGSELDFWRSFPGGSSGKEPTCQSRRHKTHGFDPWVGKVPWRRKWQPTPLFLPGESHGQRNLVDCSPWDHKELYMTKVTYHTPH